MNMKHALKFRKTKTLMRVKDDPPKEPVIIAGFDSKAITPPIS